ncbi:hypothetical protein V5799_016716 [Amblyomma americanum]|uniref:Secreted protein n=1 Tax=Amblyomma americanum TaxID=6943 RepID=A0AAQ4F492_AMBAM
MNEMLLFLRNFERLLLFCMTEALVGFRWMEDSEGRVWVDASGHRPHRFEKGTPTGPTLKLRYHEKEARDTGGIRQDKL